MKIIYTSLDLGDKKISLKEKREDYAGLQQRIEKLKEKYRIIRDQKIRERVEALGGKIQEDEDRETLLKKEKEYTLARQKIEFALESFYPEFSHGTQEQPELLLFP